MWKSPLDTDYIIYQGSDLVSDLPFKCPLQTEIMGKGCIGDALVQR